MGNFNLISLLFLFFLVKCNAQEAFLQCLSSDFSQDNITTHIYTKKSPTYPSILEHAQRNQRWLNYSSTHPLFVIVPQKEVEIRAVILCCKKLDLQIKVKAGGHDFEGLSSRSETPFVMIDLSNLDRVMINLKEETVWIQAGATLGQFYYSLAQKSKVHAFPGGLCYTVGIGGLISGGGIGTMMRKFGLAADNVVDARIMDVNGVILDRRSMGDDLFWAIRGGGAASFGVVLAWKLNLVRVPEKVTVFRIHRRLDNNTRNFLQKWQNIAPQLPRDFFIRLIVQNEEARKEKYVKITFEALFLGAVDQLIPLVNKNFPEFNLMQEDCFQEPVAKKECHEVPWTRSVLYFANRRVDESLEVLLDKSIPIHWKYFKGTSDFLDTAIPEGGWKMIESIFLEDDMPEMILDPFGGRMNEIQESELPFPHRKANLFNILYMASWDDNSESISSKKIAWIRKLTREWNHLSPNLQELLTLITGIWILEPTKRTIVIPRPKPGE